MNRRSRVVTVGLLVAGIAAASLAPAQPAKESKSPPSGQPEQPTGWSTEDMQACILAGTPGEQHKFLAKQVGEWHGKTRMWMGPGASPIEGECTWTVESILGGRYIRSELEGELPGMGAFTGYGTSGFDNVSQKFVGSWIDNHSTGIMQGTGELSGNGKALTWTYSYNCPIRKGPTTIREVHTFSGPGTMTFEMFTIEPKSNKEFQCMRIDFTRKS